MACWYACPPSSGKIPSQLFILAFVFRGSSPKKNIKIFYNRLAYPPTTAAMGKNVYRFFYWNCVFCGLVGADRENEDSLV